MGVATFRFFTPDMNSRAFARLKLESALRRAIERGELLLEYQPQWDIAGPAPGWRRRYFLRWNHPENGRISPSDLFRSPKAA